MRRSVLLLLLLVAAAAQADAQGVTGTAAQVLAAERALTDAMHKRDRVALDRLLADDFVLRAAPDVTRAAWIQNALSLCWGDRSDISDVRVREQDGVAVAMFVLTFYVNPDTCKPAVLRSLITDVWILADGLWRLRVRHTGPADSSVAAQYGAVPEPPPIWDVNAELSLVATAGNSSTQTIGVGSDATHRAGRGTTRATLAFLTSEADDETRARSLTADVRHGVQVSERTELFGRAGYARDRFAGIENRMTIEAGAAYKPALPARHTLTAEAGIGFTAENRLEADDLRFATGTGGLAYVWTFAPGAELKEDVRITADLQTARNWRGTNALSVTVTLTQLLSLKASQALEYRNLPVPGFKRLDMRSSAALVFTLQRR